MNTGGPAFPIAASTGDPRDGVYCQNGMTLLDWYAGQALPWCLSEFAGNAEDGTQYAEAAYQIAAAMLAEKARREAVVQESSTTDNAAKMADLQEANRELVEFIERLASFPLEEFGWQDRKDSQPIHGWNDYTLYVSDIKRARNLVAKHKGAA